VEQAEVAQDVAERICGHHDSYGLRERHAPAIRGEAVVIVFRGPK
jgi:hypothetical protein